MRVFYGRPPECIDPGVKRSKVKVTGLSDALPAWVRSARLHVFYSLQLEGAQRVHISAKMGLGMEMDWGREMADALWEGHTLLKTGLIVYRHTDRQADLVCAPPLSNFRAPPF